MLYLTDTLGLFLCFMFIPFFGQSTSIIFPKENQLGFQTQRYNSCFVMIITLGREIFFSKEWLYLANSHHMDKLDEKCVFHRHVAPSPPPSPLFTTEIFLKFTYTCK